MITNLKAKLLDAEKENGKRGQKFLDSYLNIEKALQDGTPIVVKLKIGDTIYPGSTDFEKVYIVELTKTGLKVYQKKNFSKPEESFFVPFDSDAVAKVRLVRYLVFGRQGVPYKIVFTVYEVISNEQKYTFICESIPCIPELEKFYQANNLKLDIPAAYSKMFDDLTVEAIRSKVITDEENFDELPVGTFSPIH